MINVSPMFKGSLSRVIDFITNDIISSLRPKNIFAINTDKLNLKMVANEVKNLLTSKMKVECLSEDGRKNRAIILVFSNKVCVEIYDEKCIIEALDLLPGRKINTAIYANKAYVKHRAEYDIRLLKTSQGTDMEFSLYGSPIYTYEIDNVNINIRNLI